MLLNVNAAPMMKNDRGRMAARGLAALVLSLVAGTAVAAFPAALDRVTADTPLLVGVDKLDALHAKLTKLVQTISPENQQALVMANMIMGMPGVRKDGSIAMAIYPEPKGKGAKKAAAKEEDAGDEEDPVMGGKDDRVVVVVPITEYAAFVQGFGGNAGEKVTTLKGMDEPMKCKDIGDGYAALSTHADLLEKFVGAKGNLDSVKKLAGPVGNRVADTSDIFVMANMDKLGPMLIDGVKKAQKDMMSGPAAMMAGGNPDNMKKMVQPMLDATEAFARDATAAFAGFAVNEKALWVDFAAQFKEGSQTAQLFSGTGNTAKLLSRLPNQPYLFAAAMDTSHPSVKNFIKTVYEAMPAAADLEALNGQGKKTDAGAKKDNMPSTDFGGFKDLIKNIDKANGYAFQLGFTPASMTGGGLISGGVAYISTSDPAFFAKSSREQIEKLNGVKDATASYKTTYTSKEDDVMDGVKIDTWSVKTQFNPNNPGAMQMQMISGFLIGGMGTVGGLTAHLDDALVTTMSQNRVMMKSALESAKKGDGMGADAVFNRASSLLPENRVVEFSIGTKTVVEVVQMAMSMFGGGGQFEVPADVSPLAMGMTADSGGTIFRTVVPMDVIQMVKSIQEQAQKGAEAEMGDEPAGNEEGDMNEEKKGDEKPKF